MKKKLKQSLRIQLTIAITLVLSLAFKNISYAGTTGSDLSELKYTEIQYINNIENIKLEGMLFLPEGDGPFPVAAIIHGSGPSQRNSFWYLSVAAHLQANGIAVLLPDKRGCVKSEGNWIGANFEMLANDAVASINYIKNQSDFEFTSIGLIGMSQGGWIAPVAATKSDDISYLVSMSGPIVTTKEQLRHEEIYNMARYISKPIAKLFAPLTCLMIAKRDYYKPLVGFDPIPYWKQINIPVFVAFGEDDRNVPVEDCYERIKMHNLSFDLVKTYKEGHGIIDPSISQVNAEYLNDLVKFIKSIKF